MDVYRHRLAARQAACTNRKFHGNRVLPRVLWRSLTERILINHYIYIMGHKLSHARDVSGSCMSPILVFITSRCITCQCLGSDSESRSKYHSYYSTTMAADDVLKTRPQIGNSDAMLTPRESLLANNLYEPSYSRRKCQCPINMLPPQILRLIFAIGCEMQEEGEEMEEDEEDEDDNGVRSSGSSLFQILVSHVCRHWRAVALNSHTLWATLDFDNVLHLEKSKAFIERAHGLPLKIHIDCNGRSLNYLNQFISQSDLMQILDLIEPEVSHWGELDFHVSTYSYAQSLLARLHNLPNAPLLKKFQLYSYENCDGFELFSGNDPDKTA